MKRGFFMKKISLIALLIAPVIGSVNAEYKFSSITNAATGAKATSILVPDGSVVATSNLVVDVLNKEVISARYLTPSSIEAGSNITVITNEEGIVTISATGGGSGGGVDIAEGIDIYFTVATNGKTVINAEVPKKISDLSNDMDYVTASITNGFASSSEFNGKLNIYPYVTPSYSLAWRLPNEAFPISYTKGSDYSVPSNSGLTFEEEPSVSELLVKDKTTGDTIFICSLSSGIFYAANYDISSLTFGASHSAGIQDVSPVATKGYVATLQPFANNQVETGWKADAPEQFNLISATYVGINDWTVVFTYYGYETSETVSGNEDATFLSLGDIDGYYITISRVPPAFTVAVSASSVTNTMRDLWFVVKSEATAPTITWDSAFDRFDGDVMPQANSTTIYHLTEYASGRFLASVTKTVPYALSQLTNDVGYVTKSITNGLVTSSITNGLASSSAIPTNVTQLINGANYVTKSITNGLASATDATLYPVFDWKLTPNSYEGEPLSVRWTPGNYWGLFLSEKEITSLDPTSDPIDKLELTFEDPSRYLYVQATRTSSSLMGYYLGTQMDKGLATIDLYDALAKNVDTNTLNTIVTNLWDAIGKATDTNTVSAIVTNLVTQGWWSEWSFDFGGSTGSTCTVMPHFTNGDWLASFSLVDTSTGTASSFDDIAAMGSYAEDATVLIFTPSSELDSVIATRHRIPAQRISALTNDVGYVTYSEVSNVIAAAGSFVATNHIGNVTIDGSLAQGDVTNSLSATGAFSTAQGNAIAQGDYSHAEGGGNTVAVNGHGDTISTVIARGKYSHAEGTHTYAYADHSHAEGTLTYAGANGSHAEGIRSTTTARYAHAEGSNTLASAVMAHAEGTATTASGDSSHAEGKNTESTGNFSHAEGYHTVTSNNSSHAEGRHTSAVGDVSHASGIGARALHFGSFVWSGTNTLGNSIGSDITKYDSHGAATFNINPMGGISGVWIGEKSLDTILSDSVSGTVTSRALESKIYDFSTNEGFYTAVKDLVIALGGTVTNFPSVFDTYVRNSSDGKFHKLTAEKDGENNLTLNLADEGVVR